MLLDTSRVPQYHCARVRSRVIRDTIIEI